MKKVATQAFERYQEWQLFFFGITFLIGASILALYTSMRFDGIIDIHISAIPILLYQPFLDNLIDTVSLTLTLYILAKIINGKSRLIDILNTALISRIPLYFVPLFSIGGLLEESIEELLANINNPAEISLPFINMVLIVVSAIFSIVALIYFCVLLYKGFKTATNIKKTLHKVLIIVAVIVAEILSKYLVSFY